MADTELSILARTDRNPIQETRYKELLSQAGLPYFQGGNNTSVQDSQNFANSASTQQNNQNANQAKADYQKGIDTAVSTLQGAGTSLADQYKSLLSDVLGQGTVAMNTATTGENNLLGMRGITNNSPLYAQQMTQAQLPVTAQNQTAVGNLGFTEAGLQNTLAQNIAGIQAGGAGTISQFPLQYGSLALAQAANTANIGLAGAQAAGIPTATQSLANALQIAQTGYAKPIGVGNLVYDPITQKWMFPNQTTTPNANPSPTPSNAGGNNTSVTNPYIPMNIA